jgi:ketosteroid isomerase-like protein
MVTKMTTPSSDELSIIAEVRHAHNRRGQTWLKRDAEAYLSFYWDDAMLFAVGERTSLPQLRAWLLPLLAAGGGPVSMNLPPADDIVISGLGDAATTSYAWGQRFRTADGAEPDRSYYETNVWYRRNAIWRIIRMHLTRL